MKFEIDNVTIIYPNENEGSARKVVIESDFEYLQFNFIDKTNDRFGGMTLDKSQVKLLKDTLDLIIKNKLIE